MEGQNPKITELLNSITEDCLGITTAEGVKRGICIDCKEPAIPKCYSPAGMKEYYISGMCEECFDKLFSEEEEE